MDSLITRRNPDDRLHNGHYVFPEPVSLEDIWEVAMIRDTAEWKPLPRWGELVHIGPGRKHLAGYEEIEWPTWDAEKDPLPYDDESVSAIVSTHSLDHFTPEANYRLLCEVQRVLKIGGLFVVVVPHYLSQLAAECIEHKSRFGLRTFANIMEEKEVHSPVETFREDGAAVPWRLRVGFNRILGNEERNLCLVTQIIKEA